MNKYNAASSRTYIESGANFSIEYDDNSSATGIISIDTVNVSCICRFLSIRTTVISYRSVDMKYKIKDLVNVLV